MVKRLADIARVLGDHREARDGYRNGQADVLKALGDLAHAREKDELARDCYLRARVLYRQTGNLAGRKAIERSLASFGSPQGGLSSG